MAEVKTKILLRNDTAANWQSVNPQLSVGEMGVERETGRFKFGKMGTNGLLHWNELKYADEVVEIPEVNLDSVTNHYHDVTSYEALPSEGNVIGDIGVVRTAIAGEAESVTAYVWNGTAWAAADGNYDASNVYFKNDLTYTAAIGVKTIPSGKKSGTIEASGKSLETVLKSILAKTEYSTKTNPSFSLTASAKDNTGASLEIGSYITKIYWDGTYTDGKYTQGTVDANKANYTTTQNAGCSATYAVTTDADADLSGNTVDGSFDLTDGIQIDSTSVKTYATITSVCTYGDPTRLPATNLGDFDSTCTQITGSTITKTANVQVQGYRNSFYYVGTDCTSEITSDWIRANGTAMNTSTPNFNIYDASPKGDASKGKCMHIPQGTKRIMFAVPGSKSKIEGTDIDGMGLAYDGFTSKTVSVKGANDFEGANYTVFVKESTEGLQATGYTISIT